MDTIKYVEGNAWAYSTNEGAKGIIHPSCLLINPKDKFYLLDDATLEIVYEDICVTNDNGFITGINNWTSKGKKYFENAIIEGEIIYVGIPIGVGSRVKVSILGEEQEGTVLNFLGNELVQVAVDKLTYTFNILTDIEVEETQEFYYIYNNNYTKLLLYIYKNLQPRILNLTKFENELLKEVKTLLKIV